VPRAPDLRPIAPDDIDELAALVADALAAYREFAHADWTPPPAADEARRLNRSISDPGFWGELACDGQTLVGDAAFIPAERHSFRPATDPSSAHLLHLFVKPQYWGSGVAAQLLTRATSAAAARGFTTMRLFVAVGQARARRFYTREGFVAVGEPFEFGLGLPSLEYQRTLGPSTSALRDSQRARVDAWREVYEGWARGS
jgi:GNAT superfamily N-acetyltransferase